MPSSVPSKDNHHEHDFTPFLQDPIGTPVPNNVQGDALLHGSDIHTQLRREAAQTAASQLGGLTNDNGFCTIPAQDLEYTNIFKCRNSRGGKDDINGEGKQQFPGFPSQNSPDKDPTPLGLPEGSKKGHPLLDKSGDGGTAMGEMTTPSHQKAQKFLV